MKAGFFSLLGLLFIGLKLGGVIAWSWFWVTIPLWGGLGLIFGCYALDRVCDRGTERAEEAGCAGWSY